MKRGRSNCAEVEKRVAGAKIRNIISRLFALSKKVL